MSVTLALLRLGNENLLLKCWRGILKRVFGLEDMRVMSGASYHALYPCLYRLLQDHRMGIFPEIVYSVNATPSVYQVPLPDLYLASFKNIWIRGRSDCLFDFRNKVLLNDFGYTMDENVYSIQSPSIYGVKHHVALMRSRNKNSGRVIDKGIMMVADFSDNYYHVLLDLLPRLRAVLSDNSIPSDAPLLVDDCIRRVPQLREAFDMVNHSNRQIIFLEDYEYYSVNELFYLPSVHLIPPQVLKKSRMRYNDMAFDAQSLSVMRAFFIRESEKLCSRMNHQKINRIFISREGHSTRTCNEDDLFGIAEQFGFIKLSPEKYSFIEQVLLFHQAEIIVGATGAAFSNLLFCRDDSKAIIFVGSKLDASVFTASAEVAGCHLVYLVGSPTGSNKTSYEIHSDFQIQPQLLGVMLQEMCGSFPS